MSLEQHAEFGEQFEQSYVSFGMLGRTVEDGQILREIGCT